MSATVVFKKRSKASAKPFSQPSYKRAKVTHSSDSEDEEDDGVVKGQVKGGATGIRVKENKQSADKGDLGVIYTGDRSASNNNVNDSTRQIADVDGLNESDLLGRRSHGNDSPLDASAKENRKPQKGPVKAPTNIRAISVIDYQPDVCKDYKQTGFCGFGDTCKFLHDRGDFKQGWQLDRDWEDAAKSNKPGLRKDRPKKGEHINEASIPFKCVICKEDYKNPIITKCGHYFCESCAISRYKKTPSCAQCSQGTGGLFSGATKLKHLLEAKKSRIAAQEQITSPHTVG